MATPLDNPAGRILCECSQAAGLIHPPAVNDLCPAPCVCIAKSRNSKVPVRAQLWQCLHTVCLMENPSLYTDARTKAYKSSKSSVTDSYMDFRCEWVNNAVV